MAVAEGRRIVASVLAEKLTEGRLADGREIDGRVVEGTLTAGRLANGRMIELGLMDERPIGIELGETEDTLIGARVGTGIPMYSTLTETTCGGFTGCAVEVVVVLLEPAMACSTDRIDVVRLEGCPAGMLTGEELEMETVSEGSWIGLAEMRGITRKERILERCMLFAADRKLISWKRERLIVFVVEEAD